MCLEFESSFEAYKLDEVQDVFAAIEQAGRQGQHVFGFVSYEAAPAFDVSLKCSKHESTLPLVWFGLTSRIRSIPRQEQNQSIGLPRWRQTWSYEHYREVFHQVKQDIHEGTCYQLNLTFPMLGDAIDDPEAYFWKLCDAQHAKYSAVINTPQWSVLSISPELFFEKQGDLISCRPMKGTRKRGVTHELDQVIAKELKNSAKDQAENLMIVDLIRNDLGRVAQVGSVKVPSLFDVEKYPTVWQMTSSVSATLRPNTSMFDVFTALFPCGSVTGAPKVKAMERIFQLENNPRGVYCGSIGYVAPNQDAVFNVAIRTLESDHDRSQYHIGSGLVSDSELDKEYQECLIKSDVLERSSVADFSLLETILWKPDGGFYLLDLHLDRMARSAEYFDYGYDAAKYRSQLDSLALQWQKDMRVRLLLAHNGKLSVEATELDATPVSPLTVSLAQEPVDTDNPFLFHKTTHREIYENAVGQHASDEIILFNQFGEITECRAANVAVEVDHNWVTPPVRCGLLNGTLRQHLLSRGELTERIIKVEELYNYPPLRLMNSVRGVWDVKFISG